MLTEGL